MIKNETDSRSRSFAKAISWRIIGSTIAAVMVFLLTGNIFAGIGLGIFDFVLKILLYYLHERIWENIKFGRCCDGKSKRQDCGNG